ncbi:MAG: glycerol-3-phosphate dehydrogenase/oxidase [Deltaproteobacteria bacterium]|nr:glycerol-3-phosphate dehydrogenase/oxidase [Deltaproteobacteria bacterium]
MIGGGINGSGIARDAALRGLSCVLLEKGDFSSGTSSKTSRILHGGLSYLEEGHFHLLLENLHERDLLVRMAPHLVRPLPALLPVYRGDPRGLWKLRAGLGLYDALTVGRTGPGHGILTIAEARRRAPFLPSEGLKGAGLFHDYQMVLPERLVLENTLSAREHGARCLNYHEVLAVADEPEGLSVTIRDALGGGSRRFFGRTVVNATGAWADRVGALYHPGLAPKVVPMKGTHVAVPCTLGHAVFVHSRHDARLFFALPVGDVALVGLARSPSNADPDRVSPEPAEVEQLVDDLRRLVLSSEPRGPGVSWAYAGLHPLAAGTGKGGSPSRRHRLHLEGPSRRFLTIVGGTFTTFRKMAEETVDAVCQRVKHPIPTSTDRVPFFGGGFQDRVLFRENLCECMQAIPNLPRETVDHLVGLYGRRCCDVIDVALEDEALRRPIAPGYRDYAAQVVHAVRSEDARHIDDVILRRLQMGLSQDRGVAGAEAVARLMAPELGWSEATIRGEVERFRETIRRDTPHPSGAAARA